MIPNPGGWTQAKMSPNPPTIVTINNVWKMCSSYMISVIKLSLTLSVGHVAGRIDLSEDNHMLQFLKKNKKIIIPAGILLVLAVVFFAVRGREIPRRSIRPARWKKVNWSPLLAQQGPCAPARA